MNITASKVKFLQAFLVFCALSCCINIAAVSRLNSATYDDSVKQSSRQRAFLMSAEKSVKIIRNTNADRKLPAARTFVHSKINSQLKTVKDSLQEVLA
ncbi:MAG: hypothetical protein J5934_08355 [Succinivibrio sp.]|nr:hypothetical protein [Succinivibrio sp.]